MILSQKSFWDAAVPELNNALASIPSHGMVKPIVSYSSARYEKAEDMVGFWAAALALTLTGVVFAQAWSSKHWPGAPAVWAWGPLPVLVVIVMGFLGGTLLCSQLELLRRLFVPRKLMAAAVAQRAKQLYHNNCRRNAGDDASDTAASVLIYVSVYEQMVEIIHGQADAVTMEEHIRSIRKEIVRSLKSSNPYALQEALLQACKTLEGKLPPATPNELHEELAVMSADERG
jgi:putative membrane protein